MKSVKNGLMPIADYSQQESQTTIHRIRIVIVIGLNSTINTYHRVLLDHGCIEANMKKRKQRKWVRFEREQSRSLGRAIGNRWRFMARKNGSSHSWTISSGWSPVTVSSILPPRTTLSCPRNGICTAWDPREILTDHSTQFVSARDIAHHTFREFLDHQGIRHIIARVKHSQTNGKIERFFGEVERRIS